MERESGFSIVGTGEGPVSVSWLDLKALLKELAMSPEAKGRSQHKLNEFIPEE